MAAEAGRRLSDLFPGETFDEQRELTFTHPRTGFVVGTWLYSRVRSKYHEGLGSGNLQNPTILFLDPQRRQQVNARVRPTAAHVGFTLQAPRRFSLANSRVSAWNGVRVPRGLDRHKESHPHRWTESSCVRHVVALINRLAGHAFCPVSLRMYFKSTRTPMVDAFDQRLDG